MKPVVKKILEHKTFVEDSKEFLEPFGYGIHSRSADGKYLTFTRPDEYSPTIDCFVDESGHRYMKLTDCFSYKMFLSLQSGNMQYRHPDLQRYLDVFVHYAKVVKQNNPW